MRCTPDCETFRASAREDFTGSRLLLRGIIMCAATKLAFHYVGIYSRRVDFIFLQLRV